MSDSALRLGSPEAIALIAPASASGPADQRLAGHPLPAASRNLVLAVVTQFKAFEALEADWNDLFARAGRPDQAFQSFSWNWHWCRHFLPSPGRAGPRLAVVTGRIDGRLVMVWPLVVERVGGLKQLAWMGDPVSQYGDVLADQAFASVADLAAAWRFVIAHSRADLAALRKVRADAVVAPLLSHLGTRIVATEEAPFLDFDGATDFSAFETRYPSRARRNRRRLMRRLEEKGPVELTVQDPGHDSRALVAIAIAMKRAWLARKGQFSRAFRDERFARFFADAASGHGKTSDVVVNALRCGNETTAIEIGLMCKGRKSLHIIVYNSKFEKSGVGVLHLEESIRRAIADGCTSYDLLAPRHDYKMDWATGVMAVNDHAIALTVPGRMWTEVYLKRARPWMKRIVGEAVRRLRRASPLGRQAGPTPSPKDDDAKCEAAAEKSCKREATDKG